MTKDPSFHEYIVKDLLGHVSGITSRSMFGGLALYKNGTIFGIVVDSDLYFKVDDTNRPDYESRMSRPFTYTKSNGKTVSMSYWQVPAEFMDDREVLADLIEQSVAVSRKIA